MENPTSRIQLFHPYATDRQLFTTPPKENVWWADLESRFDILVPESMMLSMDKYGKDQGKLCKDLDEPLIQVQAKVPVGIKQFSHAPHPWLTCLSQAVLQTYHDDK